MSNKRILWLAGCLVSEDEAKINILSPTCLYGINVFEGVRCYLSDNDNRLSAFRFKDHINRLFQSAKILRLNLKYTSSEIQSAFINTIIANEYTEDISVRITSYINELGNWTYKGDCEIMIAPIPMGRAYNTEIGITACVSSWERISDRSVSPRIKAGANYINSRMAQLEALDNGFDSALFLNREGKISEAPGACIFIVRNNTLITPPITASILESITRDTVIGIAKNDIELTVVERDIDRTELYVCDAIFLCGTAAEITPIVSVDKIIVGNGKPNKITKAIRQRYFDIVRGKIEEYKEWLLRVKV